MERWHLETILIADTADEYSPRLYQGGIDRANRNAPVDSYTWNWDRHLGGQNFLFVDGTVAKHVFGEVCRRSCHWTGL